MQSRLMRSRTEVVIAGVCGGLGEYLAIDPVIVRLIFVLVTLTSGIGLLVYPILWLIMPKSDVPGGAGSAFPPQPNGQQRRIDSSDPESAVGRHVSYVMQDSLPHDRQAVSRSRIASPPVYTEGLPSQSTLDSSIEGPTQPVPPAVGQTIQLPQDPARISEGHRQQQPLYTQPSSKRAPRKSWYGFMLLGFGILVLANMLNLPTAIIFPILLIGAGVLLLRRR